MKLTPAARAVIRRRSRLVLAGQLSARQVVARTKALAREMARAGR